MTREHTSPRIVKQSISMPRAQLEWLREEAERQEHGKISRVVQEAIRDYRLRRLAEEMAHASEQQRAA